MLMQLAVSLILGAGGALFPPELVEFEPSPLNPIFEGSGAGHWDETIRERGWILKEGDTYHLWYTGYCLPESSGKHLGYATSQDGIRWTRYPGNPIHDADWVEDVTVVKEADTYYMFAESINDRAQWLTSSDRIHWTRQGTLDIRKVNGEPIAEGPFGTPAVIREGGKWYLFYERDDVAIWLASSPDLKVWTNVQDEPVLNCGPEAYDRDMVALNQVVKYKGRFYAYYHGLVAQSKPQEWTTDVAVSSDLVHWEKYPGNPILDKDRSSGMLVNDGTGFRLYTMHPKVCVFFPKGKAGSESK